MREEVAVSDGVETAEELAWTEIERDNDGDFFTTTECRKVPGGRLYRTTVFALDNSYVPCRGFSAVSTAMVFVPDA